MSYAAGIVIVVLSAAAATFASLYVDRTVSLAARQRHHSVGYQVFQAIGVMFSVILAFVFNEVWSEYNTAQEAIVAECGALHGAAVLATALPKGEGRPVVEGILNYTRIVIDKEWPLMETQRRSLEAAHDLRLILDVAARIRLSDPNDLANRSQITALLVEAHAQRETRTFQLALGMPEAMWVVLIVIALILVAFVVLSGTEFPGTLIFAASFTTAIVLVLVLVRMLDYPFEGALALGDSDFVTLNGQLTTLLASTG